ncbi:DUF5702 domain-containing protein [Lachnospiraceae bacterium 38-10]
MKKRKLKAYLTVYLALSLTVLLSVVMALVAGIRKNTARMEEELALNTAGWSALAEYHQELFRQYDLFFIDTSYGSSHPGIETIGKHVKDYANKNLQNTKLLDSRLAFIGVQEAEVATDQGGQVLKRQIVEYEEHYLGLEALEGLLEEFKTVGREKVSEEDLMKQRDKNEETLASQPPPVKKVTKKKYNRDTGDVETYEEEEEVPIENPAEAVNGLRGKGVLNLVVKDTSKISGKQVALEEFLSYRSNILQGTGLLQEKTEESGFLTEEKERLLLEAYIFQKYGYYGQEKEKAALDYQVEYLIAGENSDTENLKAVVHRLLLLREAANAVYLYGDSAKRAEISAMAASVAAVALAPYLQPLLETSILFAWAYIESVQDVKLLLEGGKVPLIKSASDWQTGLNSILNFTPGNVSKDTSRGLSYRQYLSLFLLTKKENELLFSMMDVMEMDIRKTDYNENFRMDGCVSGFRIAAEFEDRDSGKCSFLRSYYY